MSEMNLRNRLYVRVFDVPPYQTQGHRRKKWRKGWLIFLQRPIRTISALLEEVAGKVHGR